MTCTCAGTAPGYPQHEAHCGKVEDFGPMPEFVAPAPWPVELVNCDEPAHMVASGALLHLCPFTPELDGGTVTIEWDTNGSTLELHSLARWLDGFDAVPISHEALVAHIADTISAAGGGTIESVGVTYETVTAGIRVTASAGVVTGRAVLREPVNGEGA